MSKLYLHKRTPTLKCLLILWVVGFGRILQIKKRILDLILDLRVFGKGLIERLFLF
jgi:hypothetical protein